MMPHMKSLLHSACSHSTAPNSLRRLACAQNSSRPRHLQLRNLTSEAKQTEAFSVANSSRMAVLACAHPGQEQSMELPENDLLVS